MQRGMVGLVLLLGACGSDSEAPADGESTTDTSSTTTQTTVATTQPATEPGTTVVDGSSESSNGSSDSSETGEPPPSDCDRLDDFLLELDAAGDDATRGALTADFVRLVEYGEHGFPIRCEGALGFVYTGDDPESLTVAGDFNDWDEAAISLEAPVEGFALRYAVVDLPEPIAPGLYKFVRDGADFFADPRARRFGWDEFGEFSLTDRQPDASHHERWTGFDDGRGDLEARTVTVYVPVGGAADLPALYMHDGQNLFSPDAISGGWRASETADALIAAGDASPFVIVAIDNTPARFDEYTHVADDIGAGPVGGLADEYADFVALGIKPFVEERYAVDDAPESTGIMGSSLGGLASLHIAHRHPDLFGYVASMSGTLGWGQIGLANPTMVEVYAADPPTGLVIYLDSGGDGPCPGGSDNYCSTVDLADVLRNEGWVDDLDLFYRWTQGAPHNETAWAARFGPAIEVWFPPA